MSSENFHIKINKGEEEYFLLEKADLNKSLLWILPFEYYHHKLFQLPSKKTKYDLPELNHYSLIPTENISFDIIPLKKVEIISSLTKEEYCQIISNIKKHIQRGDIYEMNFCFEFFAKEVEIDPYTIFKKLYQKNEAPFSSLTKVDDLYIISASPERFIQKKGNTIISQPMKGTAPRNTDSIMDEQNKAKLQHNLKEQNENVMIVDLVRNDLSKIAQRGTVKVEELFGIHTFKNIHQMVSTIRCENDNHNINEILEATFPMGSMTGAPKKRVLELINQYEKSARGIYSGTIGITQPNGDFDFSVVIRTILYDKKNKYLSFSVGSAITDLCDPEIEYEECLLKAKSLIEVLTH